MPVIIIISAKAVTTFVIILKSLNFSKFIINSSKNLDNYEDATVLIIIIEIYF
jgi:hypothetical protein